MRLFSCLSPRHTRPNQLRLRSRTRLRRESRAAPRHGAPSVVSSSLQPPLRVCASQTTSSSTHLHLLRFPSEIRVHREIRVQDTVLSCYTQTCFFSAAISQQWLLHTRPHSPCHPQPIWSDCLQSRSCISPTAPHPARVPTVIITAKSIPNNSMLAMKT